MLKLTLKHLMARKLRVVTSGIAVLLGVSFIAGTLVLTDTIGRTFDDLFSDVFAGTDAQVRGEEPFDAGGEVAPTRLRLDASLVDVVAAVPGVEVAVGDVFGYAQIVGSDGEAIGEPGQGPPTFGGNWGENDDLNAFDIVDGRAPEADDEVVIDAHAADVGELSVGDRTTVLTRDGVVDVEIVGVARFGDVDSPGGSTFVGFTEAAAQRNIGEPGKYDSVSVVAEDGVSQEEIRDRIAEVLPEDTEVITGAQLTKENQDDLDSFIGAFRNVLLGFALIALFVGSFIIYNTFSILVAQRTREMALLRAIGASRRQVTSALLLEALAVGVIASVLGLLAGIGVAAGLRALLAGFGIDIPAAGLVVTGSTVFWSLVTGTVVSLFAAWFPARNGAKVPPIAAMRDVALERTNRPRLRIAIGGLVTALGVASLLNGLFGGGDNALAAVGLGALLTILGVTALGPLVARPASRILGAPLPLLRGLPGTLARENAMRNPRRTSTTAAALLIGVTLVAFITVTAASVKESVDRLFDEQFTGDFVLDAGTIGFGGVSPKMAEDLRSLPELEAVVALRLAPAEFDGDGTVITAVDAEDIEAVSDIGVSQGDLDDLDATGLAVLDEKAEDEGWTIGTQVPVRFAETGLQQLTVRVIYTEQELAGTYFVSTEVVEANLTDQYDTVVFATVADGTTVEEARPAVERVTDRYPNVTVEDRDEFVASQGAEVDQFLFLMYALLGLALIIALFGIANTLALSIVERTRELGLLRAVGMTRSQLRSMVRWEAVLIALFGTVGGLGVGIFFGWALVEALADEGFSAFVIPYVQLAVIAVIAALAGLVAALLPARRAAKLDVLKAISVN